MTEEGKGGAGQTSEEERQLFLAQAEVEKHKARYEEIRADKLAIELARARDEDRWFRAGNPFHNVYVFDSEVTEKSVGFAVAQLDVWHRLDEKAPFTFQFYSPGGDVIAGMYLFDRLRDMAAQGHKIITEAYGMAASMAGILMQAGDVRRMGKEAYILIHQVSFGVRGRFGEVEDELKFVKKIQDRILDIFAANATRAHKEHPERVTRPLSREKFAKSWERKDWWLSSEEALKYGIVDEVI